MYGRNINKENKWIEKEKREGVVLFYSEDKGSEDKPGRGGVR